MTNIQLSDSELNIVKNILSEYLTNSQVFVFGSRAKNNAKPYSDLDLVIKNDKPLTLAQLAQLKENFSQSELVFKVDICDWQGLTDDFKNRIKNELIGL